MNIIILAIGESDYYFAEHYFIDLNDKIKESDIETIRSRARELKAEYNLKELSKFDENFYGYGGRYNEIRDEIAKKLAEEYNLIEVNPVDVYEWL